jgi:hypothetical protein
MIPTCKFCRTQGNPRYPATSHHTFSHNGGPHKSVDLCEPHEGFVIGLIMGLLEDEEDEPEILNPAGPVPLVIREAMKSPTAAVAARPPEPQPTLPLEELAAPTEDAPADSGRLHILCRDCDPEAKVEYARRNDHARRHNKPAAQILWTLPDGRPLPFPCTEHAECEEVGFGYSTERGLDNHLKGFAPPAGGKPKLGKKSPVVGHKKKDVPQVVCPEEHRKGAPEPYWVDVANRQGHAQGTHGVDAPYIAWGNPDAVDLRFPCTEHKSCVDAGGYAFISAQSLLVHGNKSRHWEKVEPIQEPAAAEAA